MILTINSNDGWQRIQFFVSEGATKSGIDYVKLKIELKQSYWERSKIIDGDFSELVDDKSLLLNQVVVPKSNWNTFIDSIEQWNSKGDVFFQTLLDQPGEVLSIKLDNASNELITSAEKPALILFLKESKSMIEIKMIIDRSSFDIEY